MPNEDFPLRVDGVTAGWAAERRPEDVIPAARTDAWQLVYVRSGTIEERCDDRRVLLRAGGLLFHQPAETFGMRPVGEVPPGRVEQRSKNAVPQNFARGELVDTEALLDAMNSGKVAQYFCDFPAEELLGVKGVYCTPHLGASTPESETNCAVMAAAELSDYLKNGNIAHSVNLPDVSQPRVGGRRICMIHKNTPGAISAITSILTTARLNIENMVNKSKKDVAYTLLDVTGDVTPDLTSKLAGIDAAIRVRIL